MTDSIHKQIVDAIAARLADIGGDLAVETNTRIPQEVPDDGLVIVRDGTTEPSDETLGGFDDLYVIRTIPVEVFVSAGEDGKRDVKYDALLQAVGAKLLERDANGLRSLGGLVFGLVVDRPEPVPHDILGSATVKAATINVRVEYQAPDALS